MIKLIINDNTKTHVLGMELKPCNGEKPLTDPTTGRELDCGNGPSRQDCPSGSYCHQTTRFARCCTKGIFHNGFMTLHGFTEMSQCTIVLDHSIPLQKKCEVSWYGCCPDRKTPAQGPDNAGCPSLCGCNKLGSFSDVCDPETQQCRCRPGVGGLKCDRCEPGYWGLPKISSGHHGCIRMYFFTFFKMFSCAFSNIFYFQLVDVLRLDQFAMIANK